MIPGYLCASKKHLKEFEGKLNTEGNTTPVYMEPSVVKRSETRAVKQAEKLKSRQRWREHRLCSMLRSDRKEATYDGSLTSIQRKLGICSVTSTHIKDSNNRCRATYRGTLWPLRKCHCCHGDAPLLWFNLHPSLITTEVK